MITLNCTKKLLNEIGSDIETPSNDSESSLKNWLANIVQIGRKKYLVFLNTKTLFAFYTRSVKKQDLKNIKTLFRSELTELIFREITSNQEKINKLIDEADQVMLSVSTNMSKRGSLNEIKQQLKSHYTHRGEIDNNRSRINHLLNNLPMKPINFEYPSTMLKWELEV